MSYLQTVRLFFEAIKIIGTLAGLGIEQVTSHIGEYKLICIFINELVKATFTATIAEGFPLGFSHLLQTLGLPKGGLHHTAHLICLLKRVVIPIVILNFKVGIVHGVL